jgi:hypothetical protein
MRRRPGSKAPNILARWSREASLAQRERTVEKYLKQQVELLQGACAKFKGSVRGEPDRLLSFPDKYKCLVETKWSEEATVQAHQLRRHQWWRERGMDVFVLKTKGDVDAFLTTWIRFRRSAHRTI